MVAVFAGGCAGALARVGLAEAVVADPGRWPWATLVANVIAAGLLGYFTTRLQERLPLSAYRRPLLGSGLCGGLSTFSTMQVELLRMLDAGRVGLALGYALVSAGAGFATIAMVTNLTRRAGVAA